MTITKWETNSRNKLITLKVIKIELGLLEINAVFKTVWRHLFVQKISAFRLELPKWDQKQQLLPLRKMTVALKSSSYQSLLLPQPPRKLCVQPLSPRGAVGGGGGVRVLKKSFIRGGPVLWSKPSSFYIPYLTEKLPHSCTFYWQMAPPFQTPSLKPCIPLNCCKCTVF